MQQIFTTQLHAVYHVAPQHRDHTVTIDYRDVTSHSSLGRSCMAHLNEGSYSVTCHPHILFTLEWAIVSAFIPQP